MKLTTDQIGTATGCVSIGRAQMWVAPISAALAEFGIDSPVRAAAFLAQVGEESGGLVFTTELWGPTDAQRQYEPPSHMAKMLGNTEPGDGKLFRGHGLLQVTGRANHRIVGGKLGLDAENHPELLAEPLNAARSAALFWRDHGLNELADQYDFVTITKRINGGLTHLDKRQALWTLAKGTLGVLQTRGATA